MPHYTVGFLDNDTPCLKLGQGPPLVMVQGLSLEHEVPKGWELRAMLPAATALGRHFAVHIVNRKRGLKPGESMSDIAGHLANAIERDLGEPVFLQGASTGGSVVLQLAIDRPDLVRRLVVVSSAYRLGDKGRAVQAELARLTRDGDNTEALQRLLTTLVPSAVRRPLLPAARVAVRSMLPIDLSDMVVTVHAEDVFDVRGDLHRVTAPTLVIGGDKDMFYTRELFEDTAGGVQDGRAHIFEGWGHLRSSSSNATTHLTLGFMLAGLRQGL